jgi:CubicO group peptidase (beta-lactamase class C family)
MSGRSAGLVSDQGREFYAFGTLDDSSKAPDQQTLWEIGSITKTFTSLLLAKFVGDGALALEQPVQTLLPADRVRVPTRGAKQITLVQLATHSSDAARSCTASADGRY